MTLTLAPGVAACLADGRLVLLSLPLDRYLMLPPVKEAVVLRHLQGDPPLIGDGPILERMRQAGILTAGTGTQPLESSAGLCDHPRPARGFLARRWPPPAASRVVLAGAAVLRAMASLRCRPLATALAAVGKTPQPFPQSGDRVRTIAAAFAELRLAVRPLDRCLPLSIALARAAKRHDDTVRLVLGVACNPFAAHAWVEQGDLLLNDQLDSIAPFTPILAI